MEMEDHHNHNHHHNRHDYGGMADLRQLMNGRAAHFPVIPQAAELFPGHRSLTPTPQGHHYEMLMVGRQVSDLMPRGLQDFTTSITSNTNNNKTNNTTSSAAVSTPSFSGFEGEAGGSFGGDGGTGRWPRQETLTLLEIRSRLDSKFKEANQKGPLWDEVSRIMSEEHGYQRSGKKCREKFENLYKYYKKTKEGKAGRQDGKNYRFFRQLEALYGDTSNSVSVPETHLVGTSLRFHSGTNTCTNQANQELFHSHQKLCDSLSLSNSSEFNSSSSDDNDLSTMENDSTEKRRKKRGGRSWKMKIKEFIDFQMRKLMERQESWLEKLTTTLEQKEQERILRDEDWRRQEEARIDREHKFWAKERAWIEARDSALMEALQNLTGKELIKTSSPEELMASQIQKQSENRNENGSQEVSDNWEESEITRLIQLRTSMEERFQQSGCSEEIMWEEIADRMVCGYDRSGLMCKEKWDNINNYMKKTNKKRKENSRSCSSYLMYNQGGYCEVNEEETETVRLRQTNESSSPSNSNVGNAVSDSCFRFLLADGDHLWENYGLKLSKGENQ
ncbi:trihelix transcription factor PTL [Pistacia vera]|uniref:trihelix transcription factor PTL n=1 Tax=Pistacia vera TaxID=55513 RepID=UPI001262F9FB|nr:trihelix transcription factor PTL [Pistacia vera]